MKKALLAVLLVGILAFTVVAETFNVASDTTWPPFEWSDAQGNLLGFDLDMMRCIAVLQGYEVDIISYDWEIIFEDVGVGRADIGASGATITPERELAVDFSDPYWTSDQAILVRADSGLNIVTALSGGYTVGAQVETTGAGFIQGLIDEGVNVVIREYTLYPLSVLDLINGNIDAVIQDEPASEASATSEEELTIVGVIKTNENFGFFVAEGDPNGLLPLLNDGVKQLKELGVYDNLVRAYMGTDITKVESAWRASIALLNAGDVVAFAASLAALANE
jgi:polar amino acid transport system substrate-binding protein